MKTLATLAGLALCLGAPVPPGESGAPPRGGHAIERRFTSELDLSTDELELTGSEEGRSVEKKAPRYEREETSAVEVVDTPDDDADPLAKFERLYRTVSSSLKLTAAGKEPNVRTASAGLEGKHATFERADDGHWERSSEDADMRAGRLKRLRADLTLGPLLAPTRAEGFELEPGSSFELAGEDCVRLFSPVEEGLRRPRTKVGRTKGGLDFSPAALTEPVAALFTGVEGKLTATLRARKDGDELPWNADVEFKLESAYDGSKGLVSEETGEAKDEVELTYEGSGTLAWDPDSGRIELHLQGEVHAREEFLVRVEGNGKTAEVTGKLDATGNLELEAHEAAAE